MEQSFCSTLIDKLRGKSRNKIPMQNEKVVNSKTHRGPNKGHDNIDIKLSIRKLQRLTMLLPLVLRRSEAFQEGLQHCETCTMTNDVYKKEMQNSKVIEILVDGVIEKEQIESIEDDQTKLLKEKSLSMRDSSPAKGKKLSFDFEVYCEKDEIKHSLKCILVRLQRNLGNFIVQVCYVKTRKLENEERNKHFIVSVSDLKVIKYEHSNLTDKIITLLKNPPSSNADVPKVCVACMKEKMTESNLKLSSVLKTARYLNLVMKNANLDETSSACCSRNYPHIHAECQNKPVVLKYTQPFTPVNSLNTKSQGPLRKISSGQSSSKPEKQRQPEQQGQKRKTEEAPTKKDNGSPKWDSSQQPYLEEPNTEADKINDSSSKSKIQEQIDPTKEKREPNSEPSKSKNVNSKSGINKKDESKNIEPQTTSSKEEVPQIQENSRNDDLENDKIQDDLNNNKTERDNFKTNEKQKEDDKNHQPQEVENKDEKIIQNIYPSLESSPGSYRDHNMHNDSMSDTSRTQPLMEPNKDDVGVKEDELFCGCNTEKVYEKLKIIPTKRTTTDSKTEASPQGSYSDLSSPSYLKEEESEYKKPTVQFQTYLMNLGDSNPLPPIPLMKVNQSSKHSTENGNCINEEHIEVAKDQNHSINVVDSVLLTKQRLSVGEHIIKKDKMSIQGKLSSNNVLKSQSDPSKYTTKTKSADFGLKPHPCVIRHQNKKVEQVLQCVGKDNLMYISSPADCCKANKLLMGYENEIHLPISVSLNSLPLDNEDLNYIAKVAGKRISHNDISITSDEEKTAKEYKWKIEYNGAEQDETKWSKAFSHKGSSTINCVSTMVVPEKCITQGNKMSVKGHMTEDEMVLPTITEEELNTEDYIPFMPSIPSLPMDEEKNKYMSVKNKKSSIPNKSVELRYFTVEYSKIRNIKQGEQRNNFICSKFTRFNGNQINLEKCKTRNKHNHLEYKVNEINETLHTSSSEKLILKDIPIEINECSIVKSYNEVKDSSLNVVDEMIMMHIIYSNSTLQENVSHKQNKCNKIITNVVNKNISEQITGDWDLKMFGNT